MAWKTTCVTEERMKFMLQYNSGEWSFAQLCREFTVSRKTGYKWLARYRSGGLSALADQSRAPRQPAGAISSETEAKILAARHAHPTWGPRKLRRWLQDSCPETQWPAPSSIGVLLARAGLVVHRRQRRHTPPYTRPFVNCTEANSLWCADFKGWFRTQDGKACYPFTLTDAHSRYLLRCQALTCTDAATLWPIFVAAFREFGLPAAIRTDNGPPFASTTLGGLSKLAVWWIKLGITPERIEPGHPEQNGRHERMHRTLEEACQPAKDCRAQQARFAQFLREFNCERPHEALGGATPASCYQGSQRSYPLRLPQVEYPPEMALRRVRHSGEIKWQNRMVYLSETLAGETVGLQETEEGNWQVYFGSLPLAQLDREGKLLRPRPARRERRKEASLAKRNSSNK